MHDFAITSAGEPDDVLGVIQSFADRRVEGEITTPDQAGSSGVEILYGIA